MNVDVLFKRIFRSVSSTFHLSSESYARDELQYSVSGVAYDLGATPDATVLYVDATRRAWSCRCSMGTVSRGTERSFRLRAGKIRFDSDLFRQLSVRAVLRDDEKKKIT